MADVQAPLGAICALPEQRSSRYSTPGRAGGRNALAAAAAQCSGVDPRRATSVDTPAVRTRTRRMGARSSASADKAVLFPRVTCCGQPGQGGLSLPAHSGQRNTCARLPAQRRERPATADAISRAGTDGRTSVPERVAPENALDDGAPRWSASMPPPLCASADCGCWRSRRDAASRPSPSDSGRTCHWPCRTASDAARDTHRSGTAAVATSIAVGK